MSKVEDKGRVDYSKFDNIDSDILEAYLRADLNAPEGKQMEPEAISYIIELLSERQKDNQIDWEQKKANAVAEFKENCLPYIDEAQDVYDFYNDFGDDNVVPKLDNAKIIVLHKLKKYWRRFASVAAVLVLLICAGTVTAYALGYNPVKLVGRWNDDQFWIEPVYVTTELSDKVAEYAGELSLVPEWIPYGYVSNTVEVSEPTDNSFGSIYAAFYKETDNGINTIDINYRFPLTGKEKPLYEKDTLGVEEYEMYGTTYYIMENLGIKKVIWRSGIYEGSITGKFSLEEAKQMINSIYGE